MIAHLKLALRVCAISLLVSALIWGTGEVASSTVVKSQDVQLAPVLTNVASDESADDLRNLFGDELEDAGSVSDNLWRDLYAHVDRMNDFSRQVHFLANYSDVICDDDARITELSKRFTVLDNERKELLGRLLIEVADFDGYFDMVVGITLLPAWKTFAFNTAGLEKAMQYRGDPLAENSNIPDFSRPEVDAQLTTTILSVE